MASKPVKNKTNRFDALSQEEIQQRWRQLLPMLLRFLVLCLLGAVGVFFYNRMAAPPQKLAAYLNVAFQCLSAGSVAFGFLTLMALLFSRSKKS